jgi:hypothetical protein
LSNLIRCLAAGKPFTCPVSAHGMSWWMSRPCVVDNLLHAAALDRAVCAARRTWTLPVLHASIAQVVAAIAAAHGTRAHELVTYQPDPKLEAQFASYPPLHCPAALAAGFRHDGSLQSLVVRALEDP